MQTLTATRVAPCCLLPCHQSLAMLSRLGSLTARRCTPTTSMLLRPCVAAFPSAVTGRRSLFSFGGKDAAVDVEAESREIHNTLLTPLNNRLLGPLGTHTRT